MKAAAVSFAAALFMLAGCASRQVEESEFHQELLYYAQSENSRKPAGFDSVEIWYGKVEALWENHLSLTSARCLYSLSRNLFGSYCGGPEAFLFRHEFLEPPLKQGDTILFAARHDLKGRHFIQGEHLARVEFTEDAPRIIRLQYDLTGKEAKEQRIREFRELLAACVDGDIDAAQALLVQGVSPDIRNEERPWAPPLLQALLESGKCEPEILKLLIRHGVDVNGRNGTATPLRITARDRNAALILTKILCESGADPNGQPGRLSYFTPEPPLFQAAETGNAELAELLIRYGADPKHKCDVRHSALSLPARAQYSALTRAIYSGSRTIAELLLKHGAIPDSAEQEALDALLTAPEPEPEGCGFTRDRSSLHKLLRQGIPPDFLLNGHYYLESAAGQNLFDQVELLLRHKPKQPALDRALDKAFACGNYSMIKMLLEAGADPDAASSQVHQLRPNVSVKIPIREFYSQPGNLSHSRRSILKLLELPSKTSK